jgi:hypothetical protein
MRFRLLALLVVLALGVPAIAAAATKNGITPLSPKAGSTVAAGKSPTFKMRVKGKGTVWVHVCKSAKKSKKEGLICSKELIVQAKKKGSVFQVKPQFFDYPEFWLNSPGTYYWQAYRIDCTGNLKDCKKESPVVKFKVG